MKFLCGTDSKLNILSITYKPAVVKIDRNILKLNHIERNLL